MRVRALTPWASLAAFLGGCSSLSSSGAATPSDDATSDVQASATCGSVREGHVLTLSCPAGQVIAAVDFASYGTPSGSCGSFAKSACDANGSMQRVAASCIGKSNCDVSADNATFGDPCVGTRKRLDAEITCAPAPVDGGTTSDGGIASDGGVTHPEAGDAGAASCGAPTLRFTEIDVGAAIDTNEDDAANKPIMMSPIPSGGSRVLWNGADGRIHVTTLNADDSVDASAGTVSLSGADAEDIDADDRGGVILLTRDAKGGGTLSCGDPSNLCGTAPNPPIACRDMYLVRFDGTAETWATELTQSSAAHPPYLNGKTDGANVIFVWWYAHQGRLVSDGTNYAAYFGSAISVSQQGCVNIHQGDTMKVVSPTGAVLQGHDSFDWGCSHSGYERIVWDPVASKFVTLCKNDAPTNGKSGRLAYPASAPVATMSAVDLWYSNVGNIVLGASGGYWLTASDIRPGQTPNSDGLADVHLFHFTAGAPDVDKVIASKPAANDRAPHLAMYGTNLLAVWEESTDAGDFSFQSPGRTMYLQVLNRATGNAIGQPIAVPSSGANAIYGNRFQELKAYPDGSVAYASIGTSASKIRILRVLPCH